MKITFEGSLMEIKQEISIFLKGTVRESVVSSIKDAEDTLYSMSSEELFPHSNCSGLNCILSNTQDRIVKTIRQRIRNGCYWFKIPSEVKLAQEHGVSRMTARAAVQILKDEGLVYSKNQQTYINNKTTVSRIK